jgi:threonine-phosphate decarboxylase
MEHHGILIRDASNFRGLDNHCFRITAQTPEENDALVEALIAFKTWKKENQ